MGYFVKAWKVESKWLGLSVQEREAFVKKILGVVQLMESKGAEIITYSECDALIRYGATASFFAIWHFPEDHLEREFEHLLEESGWYEFFNQENFYGNEEPVVTVFEKLVGFKKSDLTFL